MAESFTTYRIRTTDPADQLGELNRLFSLIADRFDKIEGFRGTPKFYNAVEATSDVVCTVPDKGFVLLDQADPPQYWRITVDTTGTLQITKLGATYS